MTMTTLTKKTFNRGWFTYSFRGLAHYHHGRELGSVQADVVLDLRVLRLFLFFYFLVFRDRIFL